MKAPLPACAGRHARRVALVAALSAVFIGGAAAAPARAVEPAVLSIHNYRGAIPVLCYHGIYTGSPRSGDAYSVSVAEFDRHMAMLAVQGFHSVSIDQYVRFQAGDLAALPDRPVLITFDDGRIDSFANGNPILARYGMRATMFVITANASAAKTGFLGWPALRAMAASGRWELQLHAHQGHVMVPTGPGGQTGPFYANLSYTKGTRERFTAFKRRVTEDILAGRRIMAAEIPGFKPLAFAVPYGNYGQARSNYAPIADWELGWLRQTFRAVFVQDRRIYNMPGGMPAQRYGVRASTTAATLRQWLGLALPRSAWMPDAPAAVHRARPRRPSVRRVRRGRHTISISLRVRDGIEAARDPAARRSPPGGAPPSQQARPPARPGTAAAHALRLSNHRRRLGRQPQPRAETQPAHPLGCALVYDTLLVLHMFSAAALFGTVVIFSAYALAPPADSRVLAIGNVLWNIGGLGTIVFGIWLALYVDDYEIWDGWIIGAIVLWAIATELGRRAQLGFVSGADAGAQAQANLMHWLRSAAVIGLLVLMIYKPGA